MEGGGQEGSVSSGAASPPTITPALPLWMKPAQRLAMLTADQVGVDLLHEVFEVQVEVVDATAQLGRVVAQVFRLQVVQVGARLDEGAARTSC
jgi:hypothetical protein